ncbi:MAG: cytosol nonspecific dipeptidase [Bacteroidetes bacterium HGW-Bacteroidetes-1]|jgi:dipeptidase D|nr:MAG: cytosol nonspecific dipeptidase [Bacteroidetes bacterium HGW-Bacteroidetes-1]
MNEILLSLEPKAVWKYFRDITQIPRPSKKEEKIIAFLIDFAKSHKLVCKQDEVGNLFIYKDASEGYENRQITILQSHVDMVCEKNSDKVHNFDTDPIEVHAKDGWVKANGTTLGADDGIGVAAQLAILASNDINHGPIECLFTIDEETGLTGAFGLDKDALKGRILLNLDSEDEGELFIGCAGGKDTVIKIPYATEMSPDNHQLFELKVSGLKGGHSGDDIHKGLGNANKIINRLLWEGDCRFEMRLNNIEGGNLRNALAREATAKVLIPDVRVKDFEAFVNEKVNEIMSEFSITEPNLTIIAEQKSYKVENVIVRHDQQKLVNSIYACPHGVIAYSQSIPGFVETSTNLASIRTEDDHFLITTSQRSSVESAKEDVANMVMACFKLTGADIQQSNGYPGWAPNPDSEIREITVESYKKLFSDDPSVKAIHAGLECGLIGDKYPGMDMISFGPTIKGAHSPDERINIETVMKFWELTLDVLENIPVK